MTIGSDILTGIVGVGLLGVVAFLIKGKIKHNIELKKQQTLNEKASKGVVEAQQKVNKVEKAKQSTLAESSKLNAKERVKKANEKVADWNTKL